MPWPVKLRQTAKMRQLINQAAAGVAACVIKKQREASFPALVAAVKGRVAVQPIKHQFQAAAGTAVRAVFSARCCCRRACCRPAHQASFEQQPAQELVLCLVLVAAVEGRVAVQPSQLQLHGVAAQHAHEGRTLLHSTGAQDKSQQFVNIVVEYMFTNHFG